MEKSNRIKRYNESNNESEELDARKIVKNILEMYDLTVVKDNKMKESLANEIVNDLVNAGLMK